MNNTSTIEQLKSMRFSAMAKELELQMGDPATYVHLGFEERLGLLVDAEWNRRQANKLEKRIHDARLDIPSATMEGIEYHEDRKLDKAELLRYASCKYIDDEHHIVLKGATGSGKTYIACALGNAACRKFKSVRYIRMPELLDELTIARAEGNFKKVCKAYAKADLLILDEWLIRCLSHQDPMTCWKSWKAAPSMDPRSSAPSMKRMAGTPGSTQIRIRTAPLRMPSWIGSLIIPTLYP